MLIPFTSIQSRTDGEVALCAAIFDRAERDLKSAWQYADKDKPCAALIKLYRFYHSEHASIISFGHAELAYEKLVEKCQSDRKLSATVFLPKDVLRNFGLVY